MTLMDKLGEKLSMRKNICFFPRSRIELHRHVKTKLVFFSFEAVQRLKIETIKEQFFAISKKQNIFFQYLHIEYSTMAGKISLFYGFYVLYTALDVFTVLQAFNIHYTKNCVRVFKIL